MMPRPTPKPSNSPSPNPTTCLFTTSSPSGRPESRRSTPSRGNRSGTGRTSGGKRAAGRSACSGWCDERRTSASPSSSRSVPCVPSLSPLPLARCAGQLLAADQNCRFAAEGHAHFPQQRVRLVVLVRRGHEHDVHAVHLRDLVVVDLREDQLLLDAERVVAAAVER